MTDLASISAFLGSLSIATKFLKGSLEKIKDIAVREKVEELLNAIIPLQSMILSLQAANGDYIRKVHDLEDELREIKDWRKEEARYELKEIVPSAYVYMKKPESDDTGPVVYFCPKCFDIDHKKSILQGPHEFMKVISYSCLNCKNTFRG